MREDRVPLSPPPPSLSLCLSLTLARSLAVSLVLSLSLSRQTIRASSCRTRRPCNNPMPTCVCICAFVCGNTCIHVPYTYTCVCVCARARTRALWHLRYGTFAPYLPTNPATRPAHKPAPFSEEDTRTPPLCRTQTHRLCTRHHHCPPGRLRRRCRCEPRPCRRGAIVNECQSHDGVAGRYYEVTHMRGSIRSSVSVTSWVP